MGKMEKLPNHLAKLSKSLKQKKYRKEHNLFLAEGLKICKELLRYPDLVDFVIIPGNPNENSKKLVNDFLELDIRIYSVERKKFDTICDSKTPQDIVAIVKTFDSAFDNKKPLIILESIQDPGNIGTIIRTADWFGFNQIVMSSDCADIYNPKVVRSTMGSLLHFNFIYADNISSFIDEKLSDFQIIGTTLTSDKSLTDLKLVSHFAVVFGNESRGISQDLKKKIDDNLKISGYGEAESLNVSVSSGIVLYHLSELVRRIK